jgi:hypothetical protein
MSPARASPRSLSPEAMWRMRPRVEDIDRCLENALDLLEDSKRCKSAAALALAELSLEQTSLASVLWGRFMLDKHGISDALGRGEICLPVSPFLPAAITFLVGEKERFTDPQIMLVAHEHPPSLAHLESVLRFLEALAPYLFDPDRLASLPVPVLSLWTRISIRIRGKARFAKTGRAAMSEFVSRARALGIPKLDELKKEALYARVDRQTGHVTLTEVDDDTIDSITELSGAIQELLCNALDTIDAVNSRARKVEERIRLVRRIEGATGLKLLPRDPPH